MAGFKNFKALREARPAGRKFNSIFRKNTAAVTSTSDWHDLTRQPGNPGPFFYASTPLAFAPMAQSTHGGIRHGPSVAPAKKYLTRLAWWMSANLTAAAMLTDVLGYVPFINCDDPGVELTVDNALAKPARWGDGEGVRAYLEIAAPPTGVVNILCTITYTNSKGVAGRVSQAAIFQNTCLTNGCLQLRSTGAGSVVLATGPFFVLQSGDDGIQSVESIRVDGAGDVGLVTLVFARVIADFPAWAGGVATHPLSWAETGFGGPMTPVLPQVDDDAFLSMLFTIQFTTLVAFIGEADFIWSDD